MAPYGVVSQLLALVQWRARQRSIYWGRCGLRAFACAPCHAIIGHARLELSWLPAGSLWPSSFNFSPVPNLNPTWTPGPTYYYSRQCHLARCIGAMPAWAALPAATAAASRLFLKTINWPPLTTRAASTATSPCAGSSPSPFSWTPVPSSLAAARPMEVELLARGAPNPHQLAAQVTWYLRNRWYHTNCRAMISEILDIIGTYHAIS